jgi:signal recognition particle subunit SEC65
MVDILYQGDMDMLNQNYKDLAKIIKDAKLTIKEFKEPNKPKEQIKEIDIRVLDKDRTAVFKMLRKSIESKLRVGGKNVKTVVFRDNKD